MSNLSRFIFLDIETTSLEETSGIYQIGTIVTDVYFKIKEVHNDFFMVNKHKWDNGFNIPFDYDTLTEKSNGARLANRWDEFHELFWDSGSLVIAYNTDFDLRMLAKYSEREELPKPNWGTEVIKLGRFKDKGYFCALRATNRYSGIGHSIKFNAAIEHFLPDFVPVMEQEFNKFCQEYNICSKSEYHDGFYDTWALYKLVEGNMAWLY